MGNLHLLGAGRVIPPWMPTCRGGPGTPGEPPGALGTKRNQSVFLPKEVWEAADGVCKKVDSSSATESQCVWKIDTLVFAPRTWDNNSNSYRHLEYAKHIPANDARDLPLLLEQANACNLSKD